MRPSLPTQDSESKRRQVKLSVYRRPTMYQSIKASISQVKPRHAQYFFACGACFTCFQGQITTQVAW
ncbi:hypothetical protein CY34DRAFT_799391 [Suillus luteus UH-Slu-Lm8-n1]|uniref:Uncharacterized protein n=1 Tax=Suillus luteus UH-Slu-Lm8-n1 TaxID=930992 RepID=A0A0D0AB00_9AGAM|nr:hypothetical protein CY34DRAFT_799391 [Suillus luteus UH-Slu-Lm8-n1]